MADRLAGLFGLWLALTAGNFVYQAATNQNWSVAAERSWFQAVAFIAVALFFKGSWADGS